ncbi:stage VI sporulation protein D [Paucisalibacillus globulus]|uniref:stage VI sporulation protein D n=1 Tax=Paucisalibacillus globulus TaxID=351095 RepID=UPI000418A91B|nr:stage VI sporulation protein D [Paucisalibacillus globulus]
MLSENSVFRFELNESLYFEKGQEVAEIMGISLEPEISIQEFSDYVSIRGVVELQGSYQKNEEVSNGDDESYLEGYDSKRYMERVTDTQFGGAEFMHRFPVEITVPSYRVENLDDVTVVISEFDYELPESDHLYLRSTIEIHGINSQVEELAEEEVESIENEEESLMDRNTEDSFEFEVKQEDESSSYIEDSPERLPTLESPGEDPESDRWKFMQKTQTFDEFFQKDTEPEVVDVIVDDVVDESSSFLGDDSRSSDESYESRAEKADLTYLADIFRNAEEEFTKLKLCIVQEKDTLETIAAKYETSSLHIRNQNRLEDDDLIEGQLLYIPVNN